MKIAVISDTHDLLRPEVLDHLRGCDCILHAGDISSRRILEQLEEIAPVKAVRGNNDREWAEDLPLSLDLELGGLRVCMTHKKKDLPKEPGEYDLAVYGHTHRYENEWPDRGLAGQTHAPSDRKQEKPKGPLLLNPGSCGPRLFHQPITMALLQTDGDRFVCTRIEIPREPKEAPAKTGYKDIRRQIELVIRETQKDRTTDVIAEKYGLDPKVTEQIARLYVTHPGVTVDGIMTKMEL